MKILCIALFTLTATVFALARNGWWPRTLAKISERGIPIWTTILSFAIGVLVFLPFPGWQKLVGFITAATASGIFARDCMS